MPQIQRLKDKNKYQKWKWKTYYELCTMHPGIIYKLKWNYNSWRKKLQTKGKNKTDHNLMIIENNENASTIKKKTDNHQWKNNWNTNWTRFTEAMQNNIINNKPRKHEELEKIIIQTAVKEFGLFKHKNNQLYTNKKTKEAQKLK